MKTEKFVLARAKGAIVVSNKFLLKWSEVSKVLGLEKFPVMSEYPDQYGKLEKLEPTKSNLFSHVVSSTLKGLSLILSLLQSSFLEEKLLDQERPFCNPLIIVCLIFQVPPSLDWMFTDIAGS